MMNDETMEARVERIERALVLLTALIDKLHVAVDGHHEILVAMATFLHIEITEQAAPQAPLN